MNAQTVTPIAKFEIMTRLFRCYSYYHIIFSNPFYFLARLESSIFLPYTYTLLPTQREERECNKIPRWYFLKEKLLEKTSFLVSRNRKNNEVTRKSNYCHTKKLLRPIRAFRMSPLSRLVIFRIPDP